MNLFVFQCMFTTWYTVNKYSQAKQSNHTEIYVVPGRPELEEMFNKTLENLTYPGQTILQNQGKAATLKALGNVTDIPTFYSIPSQTIESTRKVKKQSSAIDTTNERVDIQTTCLTNQEIRRIPPFVVKSENLLHLYKWKYNYNVCSKLGAKDRHQVLCKFFLCLVENYPIDNEYPHKRCLELYPSDQTLVETAEFYMKLYKAQQKYSGVDINLYFMSAVEKDASYFCTREFNSCHYDKKSQYIHLFYSWKHSIIKHWYEQFHSQNRPTHNNAAPIEYFKDNTNVGFADQLNFKAIIATFVGFLIAVLLGIINILVVKEVLCESKDTGSRIFHYYETIMDLIQCFISFTTRLSLDEFIVLLWAHLCYSAELKFSASNNPHIGRLLAWGTLLPSQLTYLLLAQDRYTAMRHPLKYNNRGAEHGKKARRKVFLATFTGMLCAVLEITIHQLFLFEKTLKYYRFAYCMKGKRILYIDCFKIADLSIESINFISIAIIVVAQFYYSTLALWYWYKFNKDLMIETQSEQLRQELETELMNTKQKFTLLLGTCTLNFICIGPWLMLGLLALRDWFCVVIKLFNCLNVSESFINVLKKLVCDRKRYSALETELRSLWPIFLVLNCFSVLVHVCMGNTYRGALYKVCKKLKWKNKAKVHVLANQNNTGSGTHI